MNKNEELNKLKNALMSKIKSENDDRYRDLSIDEIMKIVIDSSLKGKYVFWVLREYLKGNIQRFEDIESRCKQTLTLFKNNLSKFTEQQKQLNKMSFQELEELVSPYKDILTQNAVKRMNKEKIWEEIDVIYEGVEGRIYVPKTKEAAIFLGQGTKWCTAAANSANMFDYYNKQGSLYVFVLNKKDKEGREIKYQLHWQTGQFMDVNDYETDIGNFDKKTNLIDILFANLSIEQKIKNLFENDLFLKLFYEKEKNSELIEKIGNFFLELGLFNKINSEHKTAELCKSAIIQSPLNFMYVPKKYKTKEFCQMALSLSGCIIHSVPEEFLTQKICEFAVKESGFLVKYVPDKFKTEKLLKIAVQQNGTAIFNIPKEFISLELCKIAVQQNGISLKHISEKFRTNEICKLAVQQNSLALDYVPEKLKTKELCELAVKKNGTALGCVPEPLRTEELCKIAVQQNGEALFDVPEKFKTQELCLIAIKQNGMTLEYVPEKLISTELCEIAVQNEGKALSFVPHVFKTRELCKTAVIKNGRALVNVPSKFETPELCVIAVKQNGRFLSCVSAHMMDYELCEIAVRQNGKYLNSVDYDFKTKELCLIAVNQDKNALSYVPKEFLNDEILKEIVFNFTKEHNLNFNFEENVEMMFNLNKNIFSDSFEEIKNFYKKYYIDIMSKKISDEILNNTNTIEMRN